MEGKVVGRDEEKWMRKARLLYLRRLSLEGPRVNIKSYISFRRDCQGILSYIFGPVHTVGSLPRESAG